MDVFLLPSFLEHWYRVVQKNASRLRRDHHGPFHYLSCPGDKIVPVSTAISFLEAYCFNPTAV
jgi:hypothetical protein